MLLHFNDSDNFPLFSLFFLGGGGQTSPPGYGLDD